MTGIGVIRPMIRDFGTKHDAASYHEHPRGLEIGVDQVMSLPIQSGYEEYHNLYSS
jgi:hypothetical protein